MTPDKIAVYLQHNLQNISVSGKDDAVVGGRQSGVSLVLQGCDTGGHVV